ncbi:BatA domain-containing protein [Thermostilla marina]
MTFVTPFFAWIGLGLAAVPVVLHLMMRRKPQRIPFPALLLVRSRFQQNRRRMRLRHLLLLALRTLLFVLLGLVLAQPTVKWSAPGSGEAPVAAALVFDTSPRMLYRFENRTRLEAAKEQGTWLLRQLPRDSEIAVFDSETSPQNFSIDRGAAKHRIEHLAITAAPSPLTDVLTRAAGLLRSSELTRREIYVFTDFAGASWPPQARKKLKQTIADLGDVGVYLIDVGVEEPVNAALTKVAPHSETVARGTPVQIDVDVNAQGEVGNRTLSLYISDTLDTRVTGDGAPSPREAMDASGDRREVDGVLYEKRGEQSVSLENGESMRASFAVGGFDAGVHVGFVEIGEDDALPCDNRRWFAFEVRPPASVLIAAPDPPEHYAVFLDQALAPEVLRRIGRARFETQVVSQRALGSEKLDVYDAVFVLDPAPMEDALWTRLAEYVESGHGLAIALGRRASAVEAFHGSAAQRVLPGRLLVQARAGDSPFMLAPRVYQHPVLKSFRSVAGTIPWHQFPVFRYWVLDEIPEDVRVVASYDDDRPAILERRLGKGRVVVFTTPLSDRPDEAPWNLLPVGEAWPFFILVNETAAYLAGGTGRRVNYLAGETVVIDLPDQFAHFNGYVLQIPRNPFRDDLPPPSLKLTPDREKRRLVVTATSHPGCYRVEAGGTTGFRDAFAVELPPEVTDLTRVEIKNLVADLGKDVTRTTRNREQLIREVTKGRAGTNLTPWIVLLITLVFAAEWFLANRFYRQPTAASV